MELQFAALDIGLEWIAPEPAVLQRSSHALVHNGGVWLIDPVDGDGLDDCLHALGTTAGVVQLIDRHDRDCAALARRYAVPLHVTPFEGIPGSPFEVRRIARVPLWKEVALWWPERRTLVVGDALGTLRYFRAPGEEIGVHPLLRLTPPRSLRGLGPEHVLCGHGAGLHGPGTAEVLAEALATTRRRIPSYLVGLLRRRDEL
jgi:hypothetical protein